MKGIKSLLIIFCFVLVQGTFAQTYVIQARPVGSNDWGYINLTGEFIIKAKYRRAYSFSQEGLAPIYDAKNKQYYFLTLNGEMLKTEITGIKLLTVLGFGAKGYSDGLVPVLHNSKWGYLDANGRVAIGLTYDRVTEFDGGYAAVERLGKYYVLNTAGEETLIDHAGIIEIKHFSEGMAPIRIKDDSYGFIDINGKVVVQPQFQTVGYFSGGLAWAKLPTDEVGFINTRGEWIISPQFKVAKNFSPETGLARVQKTDGWCYVNTQGEFLYVKDTESYGDFFEGLAQGERRGLTGFYNASGEWVIQPQYQTVRNFSNGYAAVKLGKYWGIIDKNGEWIIKPTFAAMKDVELVR